MNQKLIYSVEKEVNGRLYRLYMEVGAPWGEAVDVAQEMATQVKELADLALQQQAAAEQQEVVAQPTEATPLDPVLVDEPEKA